MYKPGCLCSWHHLVTRNLCWKLLSACCPSPQFPPDLHRPPALPARVGTLRGPGLGLWRLALPVVSNDSKLIAVPFSTSPGRCLLPRPKSLAGSSPSTRLLTLEEAQARTQGRLGTPTEPTTPKTPASPVERYTWDAGEGRISLIIFIMLKTSKPPVTQTPGGKERGRRNKGSQEVAAGRHSLLWGGAPAYPGRSRCHGWVAAEPHHSLQV